MTQQRPKVLLVDDKIQNLLAMEAVLSQLDLDLVRALSGNEALALTLEHDFALALLDVQMPEMDGFELAEILHSDKKTEHLPIIFVSAAYSGESFKVRGVESGAIDFLEKPILPQLLLGKVRLFVELHEHRRNLLKESFQGVVGFLSDGVAICDLSGEIELSNPAAIDLIGANINDLIRGSFQEAIKSKQEQLVELIGLDGQRYFLEVNATSVDWYGEKKFLISLRDVTERHQALATQQELNAELNELNEELKSFNYTVSHDLKAPLITIGGYVGLLENSLSNERGEELSLLKEISGATKKMNTLLNHLLEVSRIGRIDNKMGTVPLLPVVTQVLDLLKWRIEENNIEVIVPESLPSVTGDKIRLMQVVQNLLENSIRYMGEQPAPRIEIGLGEAADGKPALYFRDNGEGIDPKQHEKVFGLFSRVSTSTEGSGIGLALVKKIAKLHKGNVWIESEGGGKGTTVWFSLPMLEQSPEQEDPALEP